MQDEAIAEIGIDGDGRVFIRPASGDYEFVYRAGMEVYWQPAAGRLSHPEVRSWNPVQWFRQIVAAVASEYGVRLIPTGITAWSNVPPDVRAEIEA